MLHCRFVCSAKVDDAHVSLKTFLFIKLFSKLLRCSRSKWLVIFCIVSHGRLHNAYYALHNTRSVMDRTLHEYKFAASSSGKPTCSLALLS